MSKAKRKRRRRRIQSDQPAAKPPAPHQRITNVSGACAALDCSRNQLYELLNSAEIQSYLDGRSRKVVVASIDAYIARRVEASNKRWERARYYLHKEQRQAGKGADAANP
jgi:hypothetical protein